MAVATGVRTLEGIEIPEPGTWEIDPAHSSATFRARHLMVAKVRGQFARLAGTIHVAEAPEDSRVDVTIDAASIDTRDEKRDAHLRSPDFLDVERYPHLTFRSTGFERTRGTRFRLPGELTIRDATRPVTLEADFSAIALDPWGNTRAVFSATVEVNREEFKMTWNQALETGGVLVGPRVAIEIEVEAVFEG